MKRWTLSVDGRAGAPARHGARGRDGAAGGGDGQSGRDAASALPGGEGGALSLRLARAPDDHGGYEIDYGLRDAEGERSGGELLGPDVELTLLARGGAGGQGGEGGSGGHGGRGRRGRDADRWRHGEDGGPGGDGGDGGRGSDGGAGGRGGSIRVQVSADDSYLLMAVESSAEPEALVAGGPGGAAGRHGAPGSGGPGGAGGSSHSWTETRTRVDADGNQRLETSYRSNPGGSQGPAGGPGRRPSARLRPGEDGSPGRFIIELVEGAAVVASFPARYELALLDFEFAEAPTATRDGVLEFGEVIEVSQLCVRNVGRMPTPAGQRIRLTLAEGDWVLPLDDELFIARSLAVGEAMVVDGRLRFRIARPKVPASGDPCRASAAIAPLAWQLGPEHPGDPAQATPFARRYTAFDLTRSFEARFPVENSAGIEVLRSLAPGERSRIAFAVDNVTGGEHGRDLGRDAGRRVRVQLEQTGGDVAVERVIFRDEAGQRHHLVDREDPDAGYVVELERLAVGGRVEVAGTVGFDAQVPAYVAVELTFSLWLESLELDGTLELVQRRTVELRAEPAYVATPGARVVLLTHSAISRTTYLAWSDLLEGRLELATDEWSISRYGHFEHDAVLDDGRELAAHLEDKLVVVLNSRFSADGTGAGGSGGSGDSADADGPHGTGIKDGLATDYLRGQDFRAAVTRRGTRYLIVGADAFDMRQWLEPTSLVRGGGEDYPDVASFLAAVRADRSPLEPAPRGDDITARFDTMRVEQRGWPWGVPSPTRLHEIAVALQRELVRIHPERRYLVIHHDTAPELIGRVWGLGKRWLLGHLEVRRSLDLERSAAVLLRADDARMQDPSFIAGGELRFALLVALSFAAKLDTLAWLMQGSGKLTADRAATADALVSAMLTDLAHEQAAVLAARGRLDEAQLERRLSCLVALREAALAPPLDHDEEHDGGPGQAGSKWRPLLDLRARLEFLLRHQRPRWAWFGRHPRLQRFGLDCLARFDAQLFPNFPGPPGASGPIAARAVLDDRLAELEAKLGELAPVAARLWRSRSYRRLVSAHFCHPPGLSDAVERELEVWRRPEERVWGSDGLERAQLQERVRERAQAELRAASASHRRALGSGAEQGR